MPKEIIHFAHANGFPAKTYSKLFSFLESDFEINYLLRHAHNPKFPVTDGWERLRDELREEIQKRYTKKIVGVGVRMPFKFALYLYDHDVVCALIERPIFAERFARMHEALEM